MPMTRREERIVIREAGAQLQALSAAWRDDMNKRKQNLDDKYEQRIIDARNDALQLKATIVLQRGGKDPEP